MLVFLISCSGSESSENVELETFSLGDGLTINLPEGSEVTAISDESNNWGREPEECTRRKGKVVLTDGDNKLSVDASLVGKNCEGSETLNGNTGAFLSPDQPPNPKQLETVESDFGTLTYFQHEYIECTNECRSYTHEYGLYEIGDPHDKAHPTLLLNMEESDKVDFKSYVSTIKHEPK